jgi:hypothetical protein
MTPSSAPRLIHHPSSQKASSLQSAEKTDSTTSIDPRYIAESTLQILKSNTVEQTITQAQFKEQWFDFEVSRDTIKALADFHFGERNSGHIARGKSTSTLFLMGKINLTKELKAGVSSIPKKVSGDIIINTLARCQLFGLLDLSVVHALLKNEERVRRVPASTSSERSGMTFFAAKTMAGESPMAYRPN